MTKKILLFLFFFILFQPYIVFSQAAEPAAAPEEAVSRATTCTCVLEISGTGCNVNQEMTFNIDSNVSAGDILNEINLISCPFKLVAGNFINTETTVTVTEDVCRSAGVFPSGSQDGYSYGLTCSLSDQKSGSNTGTEDTSPTITTQKAPPSVRLVNPIGGTYNEDYTKQTDKDSQGKTNIQVIIGNAIQVTLRLLGAITLAVFFYGGFLWLTSAGNAEKVSTGTKTMMYATIGLFIIFGAYGILTTIISGITSANATPGGGGGSGNQNCDAQCQKELDCTNKNKDCLELPNKTFDICFDELTKCRE